MMEADYHPLFQSDIRRMAIFVAEVSGDIPAARRRIVEAEDMIVQILTNPFSGNRASGDLSGYLVRHGGRDNKITFVFRPEPEVGTVRFLLASFGGQNWSELAKGRT